MAGKKGNYISSKAWTEPKYTTTTTKQKRKIKNKKTRNERIKYKNAATGTHAVAIGGTFCPL